MWNVLNKLSPRLEFRLKICYNPWMILGAISLVFGLGNGGVAAEDFKEPRVKSGFDVSTHLKAELEQRTRMEQVALAPTPVIATDGLFTHYAGLKVPAGLINRALAPEHALPGGPQFDPQNNHVLDHQLTEPFLLNRGIKEVISVGTSDFSGSTSNRVINIKNTLKKFDGYIVPQGETFSFNRILKEVSEEEGFVMARVIKNGLDRWGLGGGVCQVSSNVFRAAVNSGFTITERRNHSYIMDKYAPTGLDATIYLGLQDLKFVNNTPGDVLMKFVIRDDQLVTVMYGTRDTRQVSMKKTSHWRAGNGRDTTHWQQNVKYIDSESVATFVSHYRPYGVPASKEVASE